MSPADGPRSWRGRRCSGLHSRLIRGLAHFRLPLTVRLHHAGRFVSLQLGKSRPATVAYISAPIESTAARRDSVSLSARYPPLLLWRRQCELTYADERRFAQSGVDCRRIGVPISRLGTVGLQRACSAISSQPLAIVAVSLADSALMALGFVTADFVLVRIFCVCRTFKQRRVLEKCGIFEQCEILEQCETVEQSRPRYSAISPASATAGRLLWSSTQVVHYLSAVLPLSALLLRARLALLCGHGWHCSVAVQLDTVNALNHLCSSTIVKDKGLTSLRMPTASDRKRNRQPNRKRDRIRDRDLA